MPYIEIPRAAELDFPADDTPQSVGELTFALTLPIRTYIEDHGMSFQTFAEILGALQSVDTEFKATVLRPYEDRKLGTNWIDEGGPANAFID